MNITDFKQFKLTQHAIDLHKDYHTSIIDIQAVGGLDKLGGLIIPSLLYSPQDYKLKTLLYLLIEDNKLALFGSNKMYVWPSEHTCPYISLADLQSAWLRLSDDYSKYYKFPVLNELLNESYIECNHLEIIWDNIIYVTDSELFNSMYINRNKGQLLSMVKNNPDMYDYLSQNNQHDLDCREFLIEHVTDLLIQLTL
jgi:hypothetical protein